MASSSQGPLSDSRPTPCEMDWLREVRKTIEHPNVVIRELFEESKSTDLFYLLIATPIQYLEDPRIAGIIANPLKYHPNTIFNYCFQSALAEDILP